MVAAIQETKLRNIFDIFIKHIWGNTSYKCSFIPAIGALRGILMIWDDEVVDFGDSLEGAYSITTKFKNKAYDVQWVNTNMYCPVEYNEKDDFWGELVAVGVGRPSLVSM